MARVMAGVRAGAVAVLVVCSGPGGVVAQPALTASAPTAAPASGEVEQGRAVYNARCYFCHGYSGDARTQAAAVLQPAPRDFTRAPALDAAQIAAAVAAGRPGTAMASFAGLLSPAEIQTVAAFVEAEFVRARAPNTAYHTAQNGWAQHERYADAYDFARGRLRLDASGLTAAQQRGLALYRSACISCHEPADAAPLSWVARPMSYPRPGILPGGALASAPPAASPQVDAVSGASVYARHDQAPALRGLNAQQRRGARLYQANCAFCHAADGSGANWIGRFMQPPARDLRQLDAAARARLAQTVRDGLPGASMPAWRDVLSPAEIAAVAAYVRRVYSAPPDGPAR
jgi:cytochrome c oxidase cbb3-type subunit 3